MDHGTTGWPIACKCTHLHFPLSHYKTGTRFPIRSNCGIFPQILHIYVAALTIPNLCSIVCQQNQFSLWKSALLIHLENYRDTCHHCLLCSPHNNHHSKLGKQKSSVYRAAPKPVFGSKRTGIYLLWLLEERKCRLLNGVCRCALNAGKGWGVCALQSWCQLWPHEKRTPDIVQSFFFEGRFYIYFLGVLTINTCRLFSSIWRNTWGSQICRQKIALLCHQSSSRLMFPHHLGCSRTK